MSAATRPAGKPAATGDALNATLLSYDGVCQVGLTIDTGAVPDPEALVECLRDGFDEVLALAGGGAPAAIPLRGRPHRVPAREAVGC